MGVLVEWLGLPNHPVYVFLALTGAGFLFFFSLATLSHGFFFVWKKKRFHPAHEDDPKEIRRSVRWSFFSIVGNAALMMPLHVLIATGHSKLYFDVSEQGWLWIAGQAALILVITETLIYWIHRALHGDFLYHYVHKPHHSFEVPTPWAGVAFNPLDSFMQALPHHLCLFLFPVHFGVYLAFVSFLTLWAVMIHDRVSIMPWRGINYTGHHTLHHWYYDCNYGQFLTFWDRLCGTYRDPENSPEVPVDVLRPHVLMSARSRSDDCGSGLAVAPRGDV
jgi:lathosterol oxidase